MVIMDTDWLHRAWNLPCKPLCKVRYACEGKGALDEAFGDHYLKAHPETIRYPLFYPRSNRCIPLALASTAPTRSSRQKSSVERSIVVAETEL